MHFSHEKLTKSIAIMLQKRNQFWSIPRTSNPIDKIMATNAT